MKLGQGHYGQALETGARFLVVVMRRPAVLTGCGGPHVEGSGQQVTEERQATDFVWLEVRNGIETIVVVDPTQPLKVRVVGDDNLVAPSSAQMVARST